MRTINGKSELFAPGPYRDRSASRKRRTPRRDPPPPPQTFQLEVVRPAYEALLAKALQARREAAAGDEGVDGLHPDQAP